HLILDAYHAIEAAEVASVFVVPQVPAGPEVVVEARPQNAEVVLPQHRTTVFALAQPGNAFNSNPRGHPLLKRDAVVAAS
nr:hypothetical protein [Tanacetum cinerariifolium]